MVAAHPLAVVRQLEVVASERGHTLLELAISWLIARPLVGSVISGATSPEQVKANVAASEWDLTADDITAIESALDL